MTDLDPEKTIRARNLLAIPRLWSTSWHDLIEFRNVENEVYRDAAMAFDILTHSGKRLSVRPMHCDLRALLGKETGNRTDPTRATG